MITFLNLYLQVLPLPNAIPNFHQDVLHTYPSYQVPYLLIVLTLQNQEPDLKECTAYKLRSSPYPSTRYRLLVFGILGIPKSSQPPF